MTNPTPTGATAGVDLEKLEALARAATPGPWTWWTSNSTLRLTGADGRDGGVLYGYVHSGVGDVNCAPKDQDFIAAANPAAILALIELARRAQPRVAEQADQQAAPEAPADELDHADTVLRVQEALGFTTTGYVSPDVILLRIWQAQNAAPAPATTGAPVVAAEDEMRQRVRDAVAGSLTGLYHCGRVWSAWGYGTMSEDDFSPAEEDDDIIENITSAAIDAMTLAAPAAIEQAGAQPVARLQAEVSDRPFSEGKIIYEVVILDRARCVDGMELYAAPTPATDLDALWYESPGYAWRRARSSLTPTAPQAASHQAGAPVAWIATDLDGRAGVGFTKEAAKREAGEGCDEFIPLFDLGGAPQAATTASAPDPILDRAASSSDVSGMTRFDAAMSEAEVVQKFSATMASASTVDCRNCDDQGFPDGGGCAYCGRMDPDRTPAPSREALDWPHHPGRPELDAALARAPLPAQASIDHDHSEGGHHD